jgi:hypothetical protein
MNFNLIKDSSRHLRIFFSIALWAMMVGIVIFWNTYCGEYSIRLFRYWWEYFFIFSGWAFLFAEPICSLVEKSSAWECWLCILSHVVSIGIPIGLQIVFLRTNRVWLMLLSGVLLVAYMVVALGILQALEGMASC